MGDVWWVDWVKVALMAIGAWTVVCLALAFVIAWAVDRLRRGR